MPALAQGQIWWAELPAPAGRRPVLILTRSEAIPRLANVTVAPITRSVRGIASEVFLTPEDGPPTECVVSLDNIVTVRKSILHRRITALPI